MSIAPFVPIYPGEVDINSPLGEALFEKIRLNNDALYHLGQINCLKHSAVHDGTGATWNEVTLNATEDWRNRLIHPIGRGRTFASAAAAAPYIKGGVTESQIGSDYGIMGAAHGFSFDYCYDLTSGTFLPKVSWMYSAQGGAAYTNNPAINSYNFFGGIATLAAALWVNSANGKLKLTWKKVDGSNDFAATNLMILYTDPL